MIEITKEQIEKSLERHMIIDGRMRSHKKVTINERSSKDQRKKNIESCTMLKIISTLNTDKNEITITEARERPDFELSVNGQRVGAELVRITNVNNTAADIISRIESVKRRLIAKYPHLKYLLLCTLHDSIMPSESMEDEIFNLLSCVIEITDFGRYGDISLPDNSYIQDLTYQEHTKLCLDCNEVYFVKNITSKQVNDKVLKKEKLIKDYAANAFDEMWLFIDVPIGKKYGCLGLPNDLSNIIKNLVVTKYDRVYITCFTRVERLK